MKSSLEILPLIIILIFGSGLYLFFPGSKIMRLTAIASMVIVFILWGWQNHIKTKNFSKAATLEYLLLGLLALALMFFLIYHD